VIGTLAGVDGSAVTFGTTIIALHAIIRSWYIAVDGWAVTARRGLGGPGLRPGPSSL